MTYKFGNKQKHPGNNSKNLLNVPESHNNAILIYDFRNKVLGVTSKK